jgi:hypothetical protein
LPAIGAPRAQNIGLEPPSCAYKGLARLPIALGTA